MTLHPFRLSDKLRWAVLVGTAGVLLLPASPGQTAWRGRRRCLPIGPRVVYGVVLPPAQPTEEQAIRQLLDAQVAAWNKGDLRGFMAGYWNSPELSFFSAGQHTRGWQAAYDRYVERYQSKGQEMGQLAFRDLNIELLGTESALVRGRWQLKRSKDSPGGLFTLIFKRFPEGWRIVHDHTSS
jgi:beta-aspartyl-peptidase (threonine type)